MANGNYAPKYINPFTNFGFKNEANKDLLIDFLNELLASHKQVEKKNKIKTRSFYETSSK